MDTSLNAADGRVGQIPPPGGITPDFDNPRDAGRTLNIAGLSVCCFLITFFFLIRAYVRIFVNRRILLSDVSCFIGWILTLVYAGTCFAMTYWGLGYHAWEVTPEHYMQVLKWLYASSVVYIPAAYSVKLTLLLLIARVFAVDEKVAKGIYIFIFALAFAYTPVQTIKTMICTPIKAFWDPTLPKIGCVDQRKLFLTDLILAVVADLVIVLVPVPITWNLRLPLKKKLKIMFMLSAGALATGVTLFRLVKVVLFLNAEDVTHDFVVLDLTTCIELTIGIICACLPSAHFLYERRKASRRNRSYNSNRPRTGRFSGAKPLNSTTSWWSTRKTLRSHHHPTNHATEATTAAPDEHPAPPMAQASADEILPTITSLSSTKRICCRGRAAGGAACCDETRRNAQRAFDLELAQFSGKSVDGETDSPPGGSDCPLHCGASRVNSLEGRREGWLAPRSEGDTTDVEALTSTRSSGPIRYWERVWDGTVEDIPK